MADRALDLLYKSFDAELSVLERALLDRALADSEALRREQEHIRNLRQDLKESAASGFSLGFADRATQQVFGGSEWGVNLAVALRSTFRWVAAITVPVVAALAIWAYQQDPEPDAQATTYEFTILDTPLERILRNGS